MKKLIIGLAVAAVVAGVGFWQLSGAGRTAPDVSFTTLNGQQISTQDLRGKVVLVKFWATSCVTCIQQMPDTVQTYQDLSPKGYEVVAVAMQYDPAEYVRNYTETRRLPFKVAIDAQGAVAKAFGDVQLTPTAFLIDKQGHIIKRYLGNYDKVAFRQTVEKALAG